MLLEALAAFLAGRYSHKWHRRFRLAMAGRRGG